MKNQNAITLVALIITVLVLLILATATINLVINGGIINKTKSSVNKYSEEEICGQIKISYLEYENVRLYRTNTDIADFITTSLEKIYGEGTVKNISLKNKKLKLTIGEKTYQYNISTGEVGEFNPINYGSKNKESIEIGDDIVIGDTEKCRVVSKANNKIMVIPYYNLKLDASPIRQATQEEAEAGQSGTIEFSTTNYWEKGVDKIDMSDNRNKIQTYITAYKVVLENIGLDNIEVRAGKTSEMVAINYAYIDPGGLGGYWLGSGNREIEFRVDVVYRGINGMGGENFDRTYYGVRPIIIIPIE